MYSNIISTSTQLLDKCGYLKVGLEVARDVS